MAGCATVYRRYRIQLSGHSAAFGSHLAYVHGISGRPVDAMKIVEDPRSQLDRDPSIAADIALVQMGLGDHDAAMIWLNKAYEARFKASIPRHRSQVMVMPTSHPRWCEELQSPGHPNLAFYHSAPGQTINFPGEETTQTVSGQLKQENDDDEHKNLDVGYLRRIESQCRRGDGPANRGPGAFERGAIRQPHRNSD
jgi:hypothetical protein